MEELYNLGVCENTIKSMVQMNPNIIDITDKEVIDKIEMLKMIKCSDGEIVNIISSNSLYLDRINEEVIILINYLTEKGFSNLNTLFDSNPYILNLEPFEIEEYIDKRIKKGELLENIVADLDSNTYLFNEV